MNEYDYLVLRLAFFVIVILICIMIPVWVEWHLWNKGYCRKCSSKWRLYDSQKDKRFYECGCGHRLMVSWDFDKTGED